jgi:predicted phosphodiesterase
MSQTRIAVMADAHANLPALQAALDDIRREGCDAIAHLGDAVGIGPFPAETLRLLLSLPNLWAVQGNHDAWLAYGLPDPRPEWMSEGEWVHQGWVRAQVDDDLRRAVAAWPRMVDRQIQGVRSVFTHYAMAADDVDWQAVVREPSAADLDRIFGAEVGAGTSGAAVVFFGHDHEPSDRRGHARYVNPGSLGCGRRAEARWVLATFENGACAIEFRAAPYDDAPLLRAMEERHVPEEDFIRRVFYGGRGETT